jgi:hypothetical protein
MMRYEDAQLEDNILLCPRCSSNNMHQGAVTVFNRAEDAKDVQVTAITPDSEAVTTTIPNQTTSNPSSRRHGLLIDFECELCHNIGKLTLAVYQHKGLTLVEWVK